MTDITPEGSERLDSFEYLYGQVQHTYETPASIPDLARATDIPATNLYKWIERRVNPRHGPFEDAMSKLRAHLKYRQYKIALYYQTLPESVREEFEPRTGRMISLLLSTAVSFLAGAAGAILVLSNL